jgi:anti-sigma B factor antagonist
VETWAGRVVILAAAGDVDMPTAPRLQDAIHCALRKQPAALIVDLTRVAFLASAAMNLLVAAHREITPTARFGLVADGLGTSRPMKVIGIDNTVALYQTLGAALVACQPQC